MEWKIGEIFEHNGEWYQCVEGAGCYQCAFNRDENTCTADNPHCTCRSDKKDVVFKKLEKVGEPYTDYCPSGRVIYFQRYKCYQKPIIEENIIWHWAVDTLIDLELKQNKEDMEEKKLNLKPFDIQKAREGKPVCTRSGRKARIICFDKRINRPIVALIEVDNHEEGLQCYFDNGRCCCDVTSDYDLMMYPEKKEGWVNVYKGIDGITFSKHPYPSKEEAIKSAGIMSNRIDTVKICWEE